MPNKESRLNLGVSPSLESRLKGADSNESEFSGDPTSKESYLRESTTLYQFQSRLENSSEKKSKINESVNSGSTSSMRVEVQGNKYISYLKSADEKESRIQTTGYDKNSYLKSTTSKDSFINALNNLLILRGVSYQSRLDTINPADTTTPQYGGLDVLFGNSGFEVTGNSTIYLAQGSDTNEAEVRIPMPACTMKELRVASSVAPGTGETFTYTLMRNGVASNELQAQISGSGVSAVITLTNGVGFNAGDTFSVRLTTSSGSVTAYHSYSIKIV